MYANSTAPDTFTARIGKPVPDAARRSYGSTGAAVCAPLHSNDPAIEAWARHASASNGFAETVTDIHGRSSAVDRQESRT